MYTMMLTQVSLQHGDLCYMHVVTRFATQDAEHMHAGKKKILVSIAK
jgi:hypothetical protein